MGNENTTSEVGMTTSESATVTGDSFLRAFAGDGVPTYDDAAEQTVTEADQPKEADKPEAPKDTGKDYAIKYKGKDETLHLTDDQLTAMLQKGRDYDDVRKQRDELSSKSKDFDTLSRMADYFANNNGMSRQEYIEYFNAQTSEDGIRAKIDSDYPDASEEIKNELFESRKAKMAAAKEAAAEEETAKDMAALKAEYPDANIDDLPSDVQADIVNGLKPVEAMRLHELRELRKAKAALDTEIDALKKEKDNRSRAIGRVESKSDRSVDAFVQGFMGGG